ncbi:hypothetical protein N5U55_06405 [Aliarcobacter butzleri]|uniref:hypothetical protein n=1 Tax=Aliarcobacter butzleri TaxID=28197 RepID=UPI0021B49FEA|nr:hypothetical protein [Aliarcobacter butzleri]MCT7583734.1 hypothetical protein [Aliarcobacter butzleri]
MWKYFIYTCLLVLFTGCGTKEISYNKTFIDYNLNSKTKKIDNKNIVINDKSKSMIVKKLNNLSYSAVTYNLNASQVNQNVSQEFFKQYFKNVGTNLDNPFLVVNTELVDYTIFNTPVPDNQKVTLQLKVEVLYKNNVILAKTYNSEVKDFIIIGWDLTPTSNTFEKLHKGLLNIYETEFKKDLIEALKNKM